jgi:hypothetical protein
MSRAPITPLVLGLALAAIAGSASSAKTTPVATWKGVSKAAMIAAAKAAPLKLIDYLEDYCDGETTVGAWLTQLTAGETASISWTAGKCELVNDLNPLDGGGDYCVQANIRLKHPKNRADRPVIEIYLENPKHGRLGPAYAFRDTFDDGDGLDYERERRTFQIQWRDRFKDAPPAPCQDVGED